MQRLAAAVKKYSLQEHSPYTAEEGSYSPDIAEEEHKGLRSCRSAWMWLLYWMWLLRWRKTLSRPKPAEVAPTERAFEGTI